MISTKEAQAALSFANDRIRRYTDVILVLEKVSGLKSKVGCIASCVLIENAGRTWIISCEHVTSHGDTYFVGPGRLTRDLISDGPQSQVAASRLVATSKDLDLALLELPATLPSLDTKRAYQLTASEWITPEVVSRHLNSAAFICALYGTESKLCQYEDGLIYLQAPLYSALGPIVSVTENTIVADFAERELLFANVTAFPQLSNITPTGGLRNIHGISGSGLWVRRGDTMHLAGIVQGRGSGGPKQHFVRSSTIWAVREWIRAVLSQQGR